MSKVPQELFSIQDLLSGRGANKMTCIYLINWSNNGYFYVGQTQNLKKRKYNHVKELIINSHFNKKVQNVFNKYGEPKFHIIEECEVEELDQREQFYLDLLFNDPNCLNLAKDAVSSGRGVIVSDLTKQKLRECNLGKKLSKETKMKMSKTRKVNKSLHIKPRYGADNHNSKPISQFKLDGSLARHFISAAEAARSLGLKNSSSIKKCANGKCQTAYNFVWKWQ